MHRTMHLAFDHDGEFIRQLSGGPQDRQFGQAQPELNAMNAKATSDAKSPADEGG